MYPLLTSLLDLTGLRQNRRRTRLKAEQLAAAAAGVELTVPKAAGTERYPKAADILEQLKRIKLKPKQRLALRQHSEFLESVGLPDSDLVFFVSSRTELSRIQTIKESWTVDWIRSLPSGAVLWDIGANVGIFSLLAGERQEIPAVVAIEPAFLNYASLIRNILHNGMQQKILALPLGVGSSTAVLPFNLQNSLPGGSLHSFGSIAKIKDRPSKPEAVCGCLCYRMDDLAEFGGVPFPTHIKIDIDGFELEALRGGTRTLADRRLQALQVEVMDYDQGLVRRREVTEFLTSAGFRLVRAVPHTSAVPIVADLQFMRA